MAGMGGRDGRDGWNACLLDGWIVVRVCLLDLMSECWFAIKKNLFPTGKEYSFWVDGLIDRSNGTFGT